MGNIQVAITNFEQAARLYLKQGNLAYQQNALEQISRLTFRSVVHNLIDETKADDVNPDDADTYSERGNDHFEL